MIHKKLIHKLKVAKNLLKDEGTIAAGIRGLELIQKHTKKRKINRIHMTARYDDIIETELHIAHQSKTIPYRQQMKFAWLMPPPGKGSGGHLNIFRFIDFLEAAGHECRIYLCVDGKHGTIDAVRNIMGSSYPDIKASKSMEWLENDQALKDMDGIFATSWATAYASCAQKSSAKRFYFVQDFEPYFYPVGGMYSLAENTYKMGFYAITAGKWLSEKLSTEYGMEADYFDFGSDEDIYKFTNNDNRNEVFYYARPHTPRRGFEIGILTLDLFHKKHPEYIINIVGWDVSDYDIPFPHNNLKTLEICELSDLYNRCAAGLVLSYTNMSLLPLELLRCGTIPVVNDGQNNRLVSDNPYISYSNNNPHSLAEMLSDVVTRKDITLYAKKASQSVTNLEWDKPGKTFVDIVEREMGKQ